MPQVRPRVADVRDLLGVMLDRDDRPLGAAMLVQVIDQGAIEAARRYGKPASPNARAGQAWLLIERPPRLDPIPTRCAQRGPYEIRRSDVLAALAAARAHDKQQIRRTA